MNIRFFCPRWGSEYLDWDTFLKKVLDAGYDGVEYSVSSGVTEKELELVYNSLQKNECAVILQHYDTYSPDFDAHCKAYDSWFNKIAPFKALKINSQTGKDFFSFEQNKTLIGIASGHAEKFQTEISHETHRNKFNFAAHITSRFLEAIPTLRLTLDVSHWVNVAESYLDDQPAAVALAVSRTDHIHARVGYTQGPQVPDPRLAEWQEAVDKHLTIWDAVVDYKRNHGHSLLTICPEFGPAPYMVHIPSTNQPIANQWEVNEHMLNLLKKRYL